MEHVLEILKNSDLSEDGLAMFVHTPSEADQLHELVSSLGFYCEKGHYVYHLYNSRAEQNYQSITIVINVIDTWFYGQYHVVAFLSSARGSSHLFYYIIYNSTYYCSAVFYITHSITAHSNMHQGELDEFKFHYEEGSKPILIATDDVIPELDIYCIKVRMAAIILIPMLYLFSIIGMKDCSLIISDYSPLHISNKSARLRHSTFHHAIVFFTKGREK